MTNNNAICSRVLQGFFLVVLLAAFGLTACSSGGGSTTSDTNTTTPPATLTTYTITASTGTNGTVTPSGATTVTQGASQSYTITPNANYAIATLVIDGSTVATSSTHTFTNVQANHTISATFSAVSAGGIVLSLVPARTSGVAPLAVFFDASGTTDIGVTTRPFHDLEYTWSFGDPSSGTWASGAQPGVSSKNSATGPVAAHVFETPGTYTVSVTAFDGANTSTTNTTITVQDPNTVFAGTNTICFSTSGNFTGCPAGATQATSSDFVTAIANQTTNKRLLFRRGETFTAASPAAITVTGPGIVGAYGTGAAPVVRMIGNVEILRLSSPTTPTISDWRVMDLELDGMSNSASAGIVGGGGINQVTILRVDAHDLHGGFNFSTNGLDYLNSHGYPGHSLWNQLSIVDSSMIRTIGGVGGVGSYIGAHRFSFLGNAYDDSTLAEHILRLSIIVRGVISSNTLSNQATSKAVIKLHSQAWCDASSTTTCLTLDTNPELLTYSYLTNIPSMDVGGAAGGYTEKVVISDNKLVSSDGSVWTVNTGPQNGNSDERLRDIIVERNWFVPGSTTQAALVVNAVETTIRNNICNITSTTYHKCISVALRGTNSPEPPPSYVRIYNNTFYSASAGDFFGITISAPSANVTVYNNLGSAPLSSNPTMLQDAGTNTVQGSNLFDTPSALFVSATPAVPADFILKSLPNPARDAGTVVPVWSDFFRTSRPQNGVIDIGAVEGP